MDGRFLLGLRLGSVGDRFDGSVAVGGLPGEQLLGFLEALRLAAAVLGPGALGLVHPLHAAATADPTRRRGRLLLGPNGVTLAVTLIPHVPRMPADRTAKQPRDGYGNGMAMSELDGARRKLRVAAAGDIHCRQASRERVLIAFGALDGEADLALLAGDLTSHGTVAEAEILAEAVAATAVPVAVVLGNHDWHAGQAAEIKARLGDAGAIVLDRSAVVCQLGGVEVGIVGCKGFVGGFAPHHLPDFGEPSLRAVYAETAAEVEALQTGLQEVATCPLRIVLLHYSPVETTLEGEPREIFAFLGSDRLAAPILEHGPDLVLHGHAHEGAAEGRIGAAPVYNVSLPVTRRDFWTIELDVRSTHSPIP